MYLTNSYLCFFAHLPAREDQVLKSGALYKKAQRTKRWIRHWFVLKNDVLSWYQSAADPYFPHGVVDLRYALVCEPRREKELRIRTAAKTIDLCAESRAARDEWVKAVRKAIFKSQHEGAHVKVAIPYALVVDVDKSRAMDFTDTVEVKVLEGGVALDSYFFAYFKDLDGALEQMRDVLRTYRPSAAMVAAGGGQIMDTTATAQKGPGSPQETPRASLDRVGAAGGGAAEQLSPRASSAFRLSALWKPISDSLPLVRGPVTPTQPSTAAQGQGASSGDGSGERPDEFTHINKGSSFVPLTTSPRSMSDVPLSLSPVMMDERSLSEGSGSEHTYPPGTLAVEAASGGAWSMGVPSWLRVPGRRGQGASTGATVPGVKEVYSGSGRGSKSGSGRRASSGGSGIGEKELGYSILEPGAGVDPEMQAKFRTYFAFDEKETLLGCECFYGLSCPKC
jgi:sterol 3beta-glucosyltransferase